MEYEAIERYAEDIFRIMARMKSKSFGKDTSDMARGECGVLGHLTFEKDELTAGELKDMLHVGSGRMADILKSLEAKGFITRQAAKDDGRKVVVTLTENGRLESNRIKDNIREKHRRLISYLGEEDTKEAIRILDRVAEYISNTDSNERHKEDNQ